MQSDWTERMNSVMDYVEEHLNQEIREEDIRKIIACPFSLFHNSFTQITGISFSEYIRRRRLTLAAYDLQNTDEKIIDIAFKYGYQSADSFRVAFKRLHGHSPSDVRSSGITLTFYCKLHFTLNIKGVEKMNYTILEKEPFKVIGIRRTTPYGGGTWAVVKSDGSNDRVMDIYGKIMDLGLCFGFGADGSNDYMCAIQWDGKDIEGFDTYEYPQASWLCFEARGKITETVLGNVWYRINNEFLPQSKYQKSGLPTIEKYVSWDEAADSCCVEILIPVSLKES